MGAASVVPNASAWLPCVACDDLERRPSLWRTNDGYPVCSVHALEHLECWNGDQSARVAVLLRRSSAVLYSLSVYGGAGLYVRSVAAYRAARALELWNGGGSR